MGIWGDFGNLWTVAIQFKLAEVILPVVTLGEKNYDLFNIVNDTYKQTNQTIQKIIPP